MLDLKNPSLLIYLYFLSHPLERIKNETLSHYQLETQVFVFKFLTNKELNFLYSQVFEVHENYALDSEFGIKFSTLKFHNLVNNNCEITETGVQFLENKLKEHPRFHSIVKEFSERKQNISYSESLSEENINNYPLLITI